MWNVESFFSIIWDFYMKATQLIFRVHSKNSAKFFRFTPIAKKNRDQIELPLFEGHFLKICPYDFFKNFTKVWSMSELVSYEKTKKSYEPIFFNPDFRKSNFSQVFKTKTPVGDFVKWFREIEKPTILA